MNFSLSWKKIIISYTSGLVLLLLLGFYWMGCFEGNLNLYPSCTQRNLTLICVALVLNFLISPIIYLIYSLVQKNKEDDKINNQNKKPSWITILLLSIIYLIIVIFCLINIYGTTNKIVGEQVLQNLFVCPKEYTKIADSCCMGSECLIQVEIPNKIVKFYYPSKYNISYNDTYNVAVTRSFFGIVGDKQLVDNRYVIGNIYVNVNAIEKNNTFDNFMTESKQKLLFDREWINKLNIKETEFKEINHNNEYGFYQMFTRQRIDNSSKLIEEKTKMYFYKLDEQVYLTIAYTTERTSFDKMESELKPELDKFVIINK